MNRYYPSIPRLGLAVVAVAALMAPVMKSTAAVLVPTTNFVFSFDTSAPWWGWYGVNLNNNIQEWDGALDANNNPNSGSCKLTFPYNYDGGATATVSGRAVTFGNFNLNPGNQYGTGVLLNGRYFARLTAKIRVAPNTPLRSTNNDFGTIQFSLLLSGTPGGGNNPFGGNITIPASASNSWVSITQTVNQLTFPYESPGCMGIVFTKNSQGTAGSATQYPLQPFVFWIDDVTAELSPTGAPEFPPPALTGPARSDVTGLTISPSTANQFTRALIHATDPTALSTWWMDNPDPVTYSMGISDMPANGTYQAHIMIAPDGGGNNAPDYTYPNIVFLDIRRNASGTATAVFRCKTNQPNGNGQLYGAPPAPQPVINAATAFGTWGITFQNNTNVTVFGPGVSTNIVLPPDVAAYYRPLAQMDAYFGSQNNTTAEGNLALTVTNVTIKSGSATIINDSFPPNFGANQVDPAVWTRVTGGSLSGIQVLSKTGWTFQWTATDFGFAPIMSTNLNSPWVDTDGLVGFPATLGANRQVLVPYTLLDNQAFFRLEKRQGTKLLVLLPGETFAPGTATGKKGTPTVQANQTPFSVNVVIVDSQFKRAGGLIDTVSLTDPNNLLGDGVTGLAIANRAMVDSVATFNVMFVVPGTTTLSSSDITDPAKASATSSSLTGQ